MASGAEKQLDLFGDPHHVAGEGTYGPRRPTSAVAPPRDEEPAGSSTATSTCRWPDCREPIPRDAWACRLHWHRLPWRFRRQILDAWKIEDELAGSPSPAYVAAVDAARRWMEDTETGSHADE